MNRQTNSRKERHMAKTSPAALYEVFYVDCLLQRTPVLPKQTAHIAYVRHIGLEGRYLVRQAGRWVEVNQETALQRADGLRRVPLATASEQPNSQLRTCFSHGLAHSIWEAVVVQITLRVPRRSLPGGC
jgi:hypothetical protein